MRIPRTYQDIALVAPTTVPYERRSVHGSAWFIGRTLKLLLENAGMEKTAIDGIAISSFTLSPDTAASLTSYFALTPRWLEHIPFGGASGVVALRRAARAVQAGDAEIVACIGADTHHADSFGEIISDFSAFSTDAVHPYGAGGPNTVFGLITRAYMHRFGATREDFGSICVAQRANALDSGRSIFPKPLSMEDYLSARPVAEPLHLFDCVMPCAGAEGFLVMTVDRAEQLNLPYCRIIASAENYNAYHEDEVHLRGGWCQFREGLYEQAGAGPSDMDFIQTYDDYPVMVMIQIEGLGFCEEGMAPVLIRNRSLEWNGGGIPNNTCGGQLSAGQAGAAGGFLGIVEAVRQLTTQSLPNAVPAARRGIVSGYGMVVYDRGVCTNAVILERP